MSVGILILHLYLHGSESLKEKRGRLKPLLFRLRREFNISVAEIDALDIWQSAVIACALVSNEAGFTQRALQKVVKWVENNWPDVEVVDEHIEMV
jgi:uncharacterized protein YlxP (DUF503 family)